MGRKSSSQWRRSAPAEDANEVRESALQPRSSSVTSIADASLQELARHSMSGLNASAVAIALDTGGVMTCRARAGATAPRIGTPVQRDRGVTGECVRTAAVVRCDDAFNDSRVDAAVCEQLQIGSILVAPLLRNGQVLGILEAFFILPNSFDDLDVEFLVRVARQIVTLVWGEETLAKPATAGEPDAIAEKEVQSLPAANDNEQPELLEASAQEPPDTGVSERQPDSTAEFESEPAPASRGHKIAAALVVLILITTLIALYAHWHKAVVSPQSPAVTRKSVQPAPSNVMAELRHAAQAGDTAAQYKLAQAYKTGSGVEADPQQANAWLRTAAEHGNADAQLDWARAHEESDPVDAYTWYVIAGQNGKSESDDAIRRLTPKLTPAEIAQVRLDVGRQFLSGRALRRDPVSAYVWFRLSEWGGDNNARIEIQDVQSQLTAAQVREAEARASDWIRRHTAPTANKENAAAGKRP
jgi:hypothetical protein